MKCYASVFEHDCGLDAGHEGDHYCQSCDARYTHAEANFWTQQITTTNTPKGA
jgi:hypothetical protein